MSTSITSRKSLCCAMALVTGVSVLPQQISADVVLTFKDNVTPSPTPLPYTAGSVPGASANLQYQPSTEFRVVTPYGSSTNNGFKDAIFGGETWTFDNIGQLIAVGNTDPNPGANQSAPMTAGLAGFPVCSGSGTCPSMQRNASFLQANNPFNFLAPVLGSVPEATYGVATTTIDLTNNVLDVDFPVTQAQWADGGYIIGNDPNPGCAPATRGDVFVKGQGPQVNMSSPVAVTSAAGASTITFDFVLHGESVMTFDEVTVPGFCNNAVQWEFPGSASVANQDPQAVDDGSALAPIGVLTDIATNINVLSNDTDPDFALLNSAAFDTLEVSTVSANCTNGGTLIDNNVNVIYQSAGGYQGPDDCTYTISDGRGGISNQGKITLNVSSGGVPPTAVDDGPGAGPGGPYETNQGRSLLVDVLANDSDVDGDPMRVASVDALSAAGGTVSIINGGVEGGNNVSYTPASGFHGLDSFTYDNTDDADGTSTATVRITVNEFAESSAGIVTISQRLTAADIGVVDPSVAVSCVGGCTRVEVTGVPVGGQIEILLPRLATGVPVDSVFRQFVDSTGAWKEFEAPDAVETARADQNTGLCPGIASGEYGSPNAGDDCTKYTLTDEDGSGVGPNDDNPAGGITLDPVGFGQQAAGEVKQDSVSSSGCSINTLESNKGRIGHWVLVALFILGLYRKRQVRD